MGYNQFVLCLRGCCPGRDILERCELGTPGRSRPVVSETNFEIPRDAILQFAIRNLPSSCRVNGAVTIFLFCCLTAEPTATGPHSRSSESPACGRFCSRGR